MSENFHNPTRQTGCEQAGHEADETLRLLAELPPPEELTDRVHRRLADAQALPERRGFWALWMPARRLQFAAAALLAVGVAGSTWSVYHSRTRPAGAQTVAPRAPVTSPDSAGGAGGFSSANAKRLPPTLHPIKVPPKVPPSPKKKPGAGHVAAKAKTPASQPETDKPSDNQ